LKNGLSREQDHKGPSGTGLGYEERMWQPMIFLPWTKWRKGQRKYFHFEDVVLTL